MALLIFVAALLQAGAALPAAPAVEPAPVPAAAARPAPGGPLFIAPSGEPFRAAPGEPYPVAVWFARADADHDGKLTRGEFRRDMLVYFPVLDVNRDGVVDGKEIVRYEDELVPEVRVGFGAGRASFSAPQTAYDGGADPAASRAGSAPAAADVAPRNTRALPELPRGAGRYALINAPQPVVATDTDLNRRITTAEFAAAADRRFTLLDPDAVGYLTLATLPKTPVQQRGEGRGKRP